MRPHLSISPLEVFAAMRSQDESVQYIHELAAELAVLAEKMGVNLTITRKPLQPFAMGHSRHVVEVWPARHQPAPELRPDGESGGTEP